MYDDADLQVYGGYCRGQNQGRRLYREIVNRSDASLRPPSLTGIAVASDGAFALEAALVRRPEVRVSLCGRARDYADLLPRESRLRDARPGECRHWSSPETIGATLLAIQRSRLRRQPGGES